MPSIDSSMTVGVFKDESQAQQALASLKSAGFKQVQFLQPGRAASPGGLFSGIKRLFTGDNDGIAGNLTETGVSEGDARYYQQEYEAGRIIITVRANDRKQDALDILRRYGAYDAFKRDPQNIATTTTTTAPTAETVSTSETLSNTEITQPSATSSNAEITQPSVIPSHTEITHPSATSSNAEIAQSTEAASAFEVAQPSVTTSTSESIQPSATTSTSRDAQPVEAISASATAPMVEQETDDTNDMDETLLTPPTEDMGETYDRHRITLKEEQLNVSKQPVQTGEVELHKEVVTEQKTLDVPVTHEEVVVKQYAVSSNTSDTTPIGQDEEIRVPVTEERIEVTKTPVVTGEVTLEKRIVQETQRVTDTTRREELHVEQEGNAPIHGTPSDHSHYDKQKQNQAGKPRAKSRKRR
jgi:uncharacterized protein (TIGR02271 family)